MQKAGFDDDTVFEEALSGVTDELLAHNAQHKGRVFVTLDLDFANIQAYPPDRYAGIIVLRSNRQDKATVVSLLRRITPVVRQRSPAGELWIVQRDRIRFRKSG